MSMTEMKLKLFLLDAAIAAAPEPDQDLLFERDCTLKTLLEEALYE